MRRSIQALGLTRFIAAALLALAVFAGPVAAGQPRPNIVYILADEFGYGDVRALNPQGKIATPHLDQLAAEGMRFTDAHSSSSVCTPTRYGILTGRYNWRSPLKRGVLGGLSPRLIEPGRLTVAQLLKEHGYHTAAVGKWHLGMDWVRTGEVTQFAIESADQVRNVDYTKPIANGPNAVGFDEYFGISASLDMVPYTYIENDHVTALPTADKTFPMFLGRPTGTTRRGPAAADFDVADVLPDLTARAVAYIDQRAADAKAGKPFFLYMPLASPHTPVAPTEQWQGKSGLNAYADFVMQTDHSVGQVMAALHRHGLTGNTLVIFTSDNGCSPQADFPALLAKGHNPSGELRGHKADIYEGGHRVPFIARWPGVIRAGAASDQLVCLTDLMATCAEILDVKLPDDAGEDSISMLGQFRSESGGTFRGRGREAVVHHSINGSFAIRQGPWKLVLCPGSGGWSAPRPGRDDTSDLPAVQLFNLDGDLAEQHNVQAEHPQVVARLTELLETYVADGRSTPGKPQANTGEVDIRQAGLEAHKPVKRKAKKK